MSIIEDANGNTLLEWVSIRENDLMTLESEIPITHARFWSDIRGGFC